MEKLLIYPVFIMFVLYILAYINLGTTRVRLVKAKKVPLKYFKAYVPRDDYPSELYTSARLVSNLFEAPILFFIVCALAVGLNYSSVYFIVLSWIYVVTRYVHGFAFIYIQNISIRFNSFLVSLIVLILMWLAVLNMAIFS